ncbi:MAG: hypothetical protein K2P72_15650 [Sphingomonas ursincola]|nr:hypothetical protein [Sphingomonas ursincola]
MDPLSGSAVAGALACCAKAGMASAEAVKAMASEARLNGRKVIIIFPQDKVDLD